MKKKYLLFSLLFINITVFAQQPYYSGITSELSSETGMILFGTLATLTASEHTNTLNYSEARECLKIVDLEPGQTDNVLLLYGFSNNICPTNTSDGDDHRLRDKDSFGGGNSCEWNREHVYAQSQGDPPLGQSGPGADAHHLRATDVDRNGDRGNLHFITGSGNSSSTSGGWYPGDEWKGDVARILMYMYARYGSQTFPSDITIGTANSIDSNMIDVLLDWNASDPVSAYEDARNTYLEDTSNTYGQGNRNPFIDNPRLATIIWGGTLAEDRWGIYGGGDTQAPTVPTDLSVSNETSSTIDLNWTASTDDTAVTGYDIYVDGMLNSSSATNSHTVTGLNASTTFSFTILAKDAANNMSAQSSTINGTTLNGGGNGTTCINETFVNIPTGQSNYDTRTWSGDDGETWTSTLSRTDQTINGPAITVRAGALTSPTVGGGIGELTVTTHLVFSGSAGNFDLLVNGTSVGSIPYSSTETTTTINNINVEGNVTIVMDKSTSSNRVRIDDLTWTCYTVLGIDDVKLTNIKIYPNPTNGNDLNISTSQNLSVEVFNLLGKQVLVDEVSVNKIKIDISNLKSGVYLIRLSTEDGSITQKFIKQ